MLHVFPLDEAMEWWPPFGASEEERLGRGKKYRGQGSNLHALRRQNLNLVRLPISPPRHEILRRRCYFQETR